MDSLSRTLSPTLVAEYQTALPSKALLKRKLHELYAQLAPEAGDSSVTMSYPPQHLTSRVGPEQVVFRHELPRSNRHYRGALDALTFRDGSFRRLRILGQRAVYGEGRSRPCELC